MLKKPISMMLSTCMVLLAVLLTACGGSNSSSNTSSTGPTNLTVWAMGAEGDNLKTIASDFTKANPNIKVTVQAIPWSDAQSKLLTAIAGGQTPDISQIGTTGMAQFAKTGALAPTPASINKNNFYKSAWDTTVVNGTSYGVPWYADTRLLFYRTDIAAKAGITSAPKTWSDLLAMAKAMQQKGGAKYGISLLNNDWEELAPFIYQDGGNLANGNKYTLNTTQTIDALNYYKEFFAQGLTPSSEPTGFDPVQSFVQGQTPMLFSGAYIMSQIATEGGSAMNGKWAVAPMPGKVNNDSFIGGGDMAVFKNSPHQDAAWKFIQYVSQPEVQAKWYATMTDLPTVPTVFDQSQLANDKNAQIFRSQLNATQAPPAFDSFDQVSQIINNDMALVMAGKMTSAQAAQDMQTKATAAAAGSSN
jgi:multiple sugar transport system substrate-binding protein